MGRATTAASLFVVAAAISIACWTMARGCGHGPHDAGTTTQRDPAAGTSSRHPVPRAQRGGERGSPVSPDAPTVAPGRRLVTIRVVADEDGSPVPGATIDIDRAAGEWTQAPVPPAIDDADLMPGRMSMTADANGCAVFGLPREGAFSCVVRAAGRLPALEALGPADATVRLERSIPFVVTVIANEDERPIPGAKVELCATGGPLYSPQFQPVLASVRTDADGRSAIHVDRIEGPLGLARGRFVRVSAPGRETLIDGPDVLHGVARLERGISVSGVVVHGDGSPAAGVRIVSSAAGPFDTVSAADGSFRIDGFGRSDERIGLHALRTGDAPMLIEAGAGADDVRIVLQPTVPVRIRVEGPPGRVSVHGFCDSGHGGFPEAPGSDGSWLFHGPPGTTLRFGARVWGPGLDGGEGGACLAIGSARIVVAPDLPEVLVRLEPVPRSYARVAVAAESFDIESVSAEALSDERRDPEDESRLLAFELPPGSSVDVHVRLRSAERVAVGTATISVRTSAVPPSAPTPIDPALAPRVAWRILDASGHALAPDSAISVEIRSPDDDSMVVEGDWTGRLAELPAWAPPLIAGRRYTVAVAPHGRCVATAEFTAVPGTASQVEVRCADLNFVKGRVTDASGRPFPCRVRTPAGSIETNRDGTFEVAIGSAPEGEISVHRSDVRGSSGPLLRRDVAVAPGATLDVGTLAIPGPFTIRGRVLAPSGRPASGAWASFAGRLCTAAMQVPTGPDGRFELSIACADEGVLVAAKPGFGTAWLRATAGSAESVDAPEAELRLSEPCMVRLAAAGRSVPLEVRPAAAAFAWPLLDAARRYRLGVADWQWTILDLPPGTLVISELGGLRRSVTVETVPGRVVEATLR